MEMKKLLESFNHAINGVVDAVRTQRNMKIHIIASIGVLIACFFFNVSKVEFLALAITITMVISAELVKYSYRSGSRLKYQLLSSIS